MIQPGERKIKSIEEFPRRESKHDVRRFMGLASFFRHFIPKFSNIVLPVTNLLKDTVTFEWSKECKEAFETFKKGLVEKPVLRVYNPKAHKTELRTDASAKGVGAILFQAEEEGNPLHMVYAVSRRTSEIEEKYHSSRLELMAIVWTLERLRSFLIGIPFTIVADCRCLVNVNAWKTQNSQISRWINQLSEFDRSIQHRNGEKMAHVDALSRAPIRTSELESILEIVTRDDEILMHQRTDNDIVEIIKILEKKEKE